MVLVERRAAASDPAVFIPPVEPEDLLLAEDATW
jgi:hypothetical protein